VIGLIFQFGSKTKSFGDLLRRGHPAAQAQFRGGKEFPNIHGTASFYPVLDGMLVAAEAFGLPVNKGECPGGFFGFHIHEGRSCNGSEKEPFAATGGHYNPTGCSHPFHAGDMPPLFGDERGYAWMSFYTKRLVLDDIIGRTVVVHRDADDFATQPSGHSGMKIACGVIRRK
jgi:Cu-Zn family superoxide dismutase